MRSAVFLDRDGTIIEDVGYLHDLDQIAFYPFANDAIRALNRSGLAVVVVTNQSGVARGLITEAFVDETHARLSATLAAGGAFIEAYYYCPHHPAGTVAEYAKACDCRKPASGLIDRAVRDLGLDPTRSFVVGDKWLDLGVARTVGARGILVRTGSGAWEEAHKRPSDPDADAIVDNLAAAASWILGSLESRV